jgi:putative phosphoesterase
MKLCIVSDSHDRADALAQAVGEARELGAQAVIHCGDLIGAQTILPALGHGLPVHLIHGNNVGDVQALHRQARASAERGDRGAAGGKGALHYHGGDAQIELGGRRVFVVHHDHYGYAMACTGEWDLVCCGHSHRAEARQVPDVKGGRSWLVNPGTVAGLAAPRTWVLADLATMTFEVRELAPAVSQ